MPTPPIRVRCARVRLRALGAALAGLALVLVAAERAAAFNLDDVAKRAKRIAAQKYREPERNQPSWMREITYDQWRDIRFRPERALWLDKNLPFTVQFFHPGFFYDRSLRINEVAPTGVSSYPFAPDKFDGSTGRELIPSDLPTEANSG